MPHIGVYKKRPTTRTHTHIHSHAHTHTHTHTRTCTHTHTHTHTHNTTRPTKRDLQKRRLYSSPYLLALPSSNSQPPWARQHTERVYMCMSKEIYPKRLVKETVWFFTVSHCAAKLKEASSLSSQRNEIYKETQYVSFAGLLW